MKKFSDILNDIDAEVSDFTDYAGELSEIYFKKVKNLLSQLSLDSNGDIKITVSNLNVIGKVKGLLVKMGKDKTYVNNIIDLNSVIKDITGKMINYFSNQFDEELNQSVIKKIEEQAFTKTAENLGNAGIQQNVIKHAIDIIKRNVNSSASFEDLKDELETEMLGDKNIDGRFMRYTKQVVNDALHGVQRQLNFMAANKVDTQWYQYIGGLVKHSRPWCIAMEQKGFAHESELPAICRGNIDGEQVSLQGLIPGTNQTNVLHNCGGYNCQHSFVPVSPDAVPSKIRREYEPDVEADDDELSDKRPKRKK